MRFPPRRRRRPGGRPRRMLARADRLFNRGEYSEAAPIFERLAKGAARRGRPDRAGDLYLRSARCHLETGDVSLAVEQAKQALRLFGRAGRLGKIERLMPKIVDALREKGHRSEADALQQEVEARLAEAPRGAPPGRPALSGVEGPAIAQRELPAKCSACGAPVKPDDATSSTISRKWRWLDRQTAECTYCGSILKAT